ncbi:MAG: hypothetical protein HY690_03375 [Chloroflexi bacterium]|nr:hypothetical protein [Chloroflexota bacterium]
MPIVMEMVWRGFTPEQYDAARKLINLEGDPPTGAMYHVVSFSGQGIHVTDVWESAEAFQRFVDTRLMPGIQQLGIQGQPQIEIRPTHAIFAPAYAPTGRQR